MSDEAILGYVKSIDERTARMETAFTTTLQNQKKESDDKHKESDGRIKSLENSRLAARAGLAALTLGGTTGAAKAGLIDKVVSMFSGGGS